MAEEDLVIGDPVTVDDGEEVEFVPATDVENIQAAYFALCAVEEIDVKLLDSKGAGSAIKRIKQQSLEIIAKCISRIHEEIFFEES